MKFTTENVKPGTLYYKENARGVSTLLHVNGDLDVNCILAHWSSPDNGWDHNHWFPDSNGTANDVVEVGPMTSQEFARLKGMPLRKIREKGAELWNKK